MNKKIIIPATLTLAGAIMLSGCGNTTEEVMSIEIEESTTPAQVDDYDVPICDENGNVYANEQDAAAAGLSEAQYGATYCQYIGDEESDEIVTEKTTPAVKKETAEKRKL